MGIASISILSSVSKSHYLLALNAHPRIGSRTIRKILMAFPDPAKLWSVKRSEIEGKLEPKVALLALEAIDLYRPDEEVEVLKKHNIGYLTYFDNDYPTLLKELFDAPAVLYLRGNPGALNAAGISVVGSRKYSQYGTQATKKIVGECVEVGLSIISGLALGIDGCAHRVAMSMGGTTVAVLACGLDQVYPSSHLSLAREIIASGGAIISEYPPKTPALKQHFPARNRIIAGLSLGTLVVEAGENSGSLITAECALEYNREVFAVPGQYDSEQSRGANLLIQKGAKLVLSVDDILSELPVESSKNTRISKECSLETEDEKRLFELLTSSEQPVDYLVTESGLSVIAVNAALTMLEMKGIIMNIGGGRYKKIL